MTNAVSQQQPDPAKEIQYWLQYIECAMQHPILPSGSHAYHSHLSTVPEIRDLYHCIYKLYTEESSSLNFREPVNALETGAFNYYQVVEQPLSLREVLDRMAEGNYYSTAEQVLQDIELIWTNCAKFNGPTSPLMEEAKKCAAALERIQQRFEEEKPAPKAAVDDFFELMQKHGTPEVNKALLDYFQKNDPSVLVDEEVLLDNLTNKQLRAIIRIVEQITRKNS
ncbi:unnamed protein product [Phytomonas sp. EM1]|nr:unnamed protein product [Phytomonas sp. EM1]|eukprot:CCW65659.1 unnamed protein product [Phytomonas sp. isolate EM1]